MQISDQLMYFIARDGYLAIFLLVFSQEAGIPNPIPNELVLLVSGYLSFIGLLKLPIVIGVALLADFSATTILHTLFFYSGSYLLSHKPRWLPIPAKTIERMKNQIKLSGQLGIFIGRLSPFVRGYTAVIAGLLQIRPRVFLPIGIITAIIWASLYVSTGYLLGPFWNKIAPNVINIQYIALSMILVVILLMLTFKWISLKTIKKGK